jgi:hypothetical protein
VAHFLEVSIEPPDDFALLPASCFRSSLPPVPFAITITKVS